MPFTSGLLFTVFTSTTDRQALTAEGCLPCQAFLLLLNTPGALHRVPPLDGM
jgi:hypothetical protein